LAELRSLRKPEENVRVYAISVASPEQSRDFTQKIAADGKGSVSFQLLSDPGHRVIDAYGLRDPEYNGQKFEGIPHPAVYVLDKNRRVAWMALEEDYKKRPSNTEIRNALDALNR